MTLSRNPAVKTTLRIGILGHARWLQRLCPARLRLISNLLALVALFSIGFV
jgi:hypothetical protein